ncbi:MAG: 30S ribosomal protein S16 [Deltaproteobacteria bacterium]
MAVKIRLTRMGVKKRPFYRIVVADSQSPRDGSFLEVIGHYDPKSEPPKVELNAERFSYWIGKGALPSDTVRTLVKKTGKAPKAA